jgi:hypothetical protein
MARSTEGIVIMIKTNLNPADAALVRDCELEAQDAENIGKDLAAGGSGEVESLCSLGRDRDHTPYSDDVEDNILNRLASSAIDEKALQLGINYGMGSDCVRVAFRVAFRMRVEEIFGSVSQRAVEFFEQRLIDEGLAA